MNEYPCKECLIVGVCTEYCDKIVLNNHYLLKELIDKKVCPDCGSNKIIVKTVNSYSFDGQGRKRNFYTVCNECRTRISIVMMPNKNFPYCLREVRFQENSIYNDNRGWKYTFRYFIDELLVPEIKKNYG